jgi:hypothetical protein
MRRMAFAVGFVIACGATPARADTLPIIDNLPSTYTPGQSFQFQISLPELTQFTSYSLGLVFNTDTDNPALSASATAATSNYPFPSSAGFTATPGGGGPNSTQVTLTLSDSIPFPGVTVTPGTNDQLATVTVTPDASLTGEIDLSIDPNSLFFYNTEDFNYSMPTNIPPIEQTMGGGSPVPAPASAVLLGIGGLVFGVRVRLRRTVSVTRT